MAKDTWFVTKEQVERWLKLLQSEPSVPGDGIDILKTNFETILKRMAEIDEVIQKELTMKDIVVGKTYRIKPSSNVKENFHGLIIEIKEKKRTRCTVKEQSTGKLYNVYPEYLEEV